MKNLKYILILAVLTCSVTAYGSSSFSISITLAPAREPVYIYRTVPVYQRSVVYYTSPQAVYTCAQPVYVNRTTVYRQPEFGLSFSWGGDKHINRNSGRDGFNVGQRDNRGGGRDGRQRDGGRSGGRDQRRAHR